MVLAVSVQFTQDTVMSTDLIPFSFDAHEIRLIDCSGEIWFVATDVAAVLAYRDVFNMLRNLDDDEKGTHNLSTHGGDQELSIISESGLYAAILKSRKSEAKRFRKWVTSEVLPAIRKTGHYELPNAAQTLLLSELIHAKAHTAPDALYRKAVSEIWSRFKNQFRVPRYADLPRDQLTDAILYVNALELHCVKRLAADGNPPFLQGEIGTRLLIRLEGGGRYSVTPLGLTELVVDLADLVAIDQALDTWRDFAKRKELGYYRAGAANVASTRP